MLQPMHLRESLARHIVSVSIRCVIASVIHLRWYVLRRGGLVLLLWRRDIRVADRLLCRLRRGLGSVGLMLVEMLVVRRGVSIGTGALRLGGHKATVGLFRVRGCRWRCLGRSARRKYIGRLQ